MTLFNSKVNSYFGKLRHMPNQTRALKQINSIKVRDIIDKVLII